MEATVDHTDSMLRFLEASPSPYHCVATCKDALTAAGFGEVDERSARAAVAPGDAGFVSRAGSIIAWRAGSAPVAEAGFRMMGAHTDSPNLRIKPRPDSPVEGYQRWGVEVYGGVLLATWPDRDLGLAGRVFVRDEGAPSPRLLNISRPIARIPNLAIHLNRGVNKEGLVLDQQNHLPVMVGTGEGAFLDLVAGELDVAKDAIVSYDLGLYDVQPPSTGGLNDEFVFSARLDNQASCYQALAALLEAKTAAHTQVMVLFDHEEVGSRSSHGAMGAFLMHELTQLERQHEMKASGGVERALANSWMISMDMAHGVHPNYAAHHEPNHKPVMNNGPVVKEHVEQRYATDAETSAFFKDAAQKVDVPVQDFVIRTDLACGSTIGPISSAQLGVRTVDVGNAMLSMHSIREQCGAKDTEMMVRVLGEILR